MPHQCTNCGRTFADGSKEMLSGCPDCGGKKFQFAPAGTAGGSSAPGGNPDATGGGSGDGGPDGGSSRGVTTRAAETVRGWVSSSESDGSGPASSDSGTESGSNPALESGSDPAVELESTPPADAADEPLDGSESPPDASETDAAEETSTFTEWPDTARRPEDRSQPPATSSSPSASESEPTDDRHRPDDEPVESAPASIERDGDIEREGEDGTPGPLEGDTEAAGLETDTESVDLETEDTAQADARSAVVPSDDLPDQSAAPPAEPNSLSSAGEDQPPDHGRVVSEPSGQRPSIEELRAELNDQFESIKILEPGQYELNLMELYNRDEYIISLQEDGRYVIDVPDSWRDADEG